MTLLYRLFHPSRSVPQAAGFGTYNPFKLARRLKEWETHRRCRAMALEFRQSALARGDTRDQHTAEKDAKRETTAMLRIEVGRG